MLLYHGSNIIVKQPMLVPTYNPRDFGSAFYLTASAEQARKWTNAKVSNYGGQRVVNVYFFDEKLLSQLEVREFRGTSGAWLDFIVQYRSATGGVYGRNVDGMFVRGRNHHNYDVVIGELSDDNKYGEINDYIKRKYTRDEILQRLKSKRSGTDQWAFCTHKALEMLTLTHIEYLREDGVWVKNRTQIT